MANTYTAQEMREIADTDLFYHSTAAEMLRQAADALEREKYEYMLKTKDAEFGFFTLERAKEFKQQHKLDGSVFRRTIGEWEEVKE